ncbi:hypothetical protein FOQG_15478, partial [Fusarium oxysporum f. sp. raphani 54005]
PPAASQYWPEGLDVRNPGAAVEALQQVADAAPVSGAGYRDSESQRLESGSTWASRLEHVNQRK